MVSWRRTRYYHVTVSSETFDGCQGFLKRTEVSNPPTERDFSFQGIVPTAFTCTLNTSLETTKSGKKWQAPHSPPRSPT